VIKNQLVLGAGLGIKLSGITKLMIYRIWLQSTRRGKVGVGELGYRSNGKVAVK